MSYLVFLIVGLSLAVIIGAELGGPFMGLAAIGFWVAHVFFLNWRHKTASLQSMSDSELSDVLDWWTGRGPFGRNTPDLSRVRRNGTDDQLRSALKRVISIYDELIRRTEKYGFSTSDYERTRSLLIDELSRLSTQASSR
jgi:hypothetical protein